ncbi:hypothetical protein GCM10009416_18850 [Craurococcus roseus]|uniref:Uncharacterized protein n=1 Tax=Craurococcus roseus TaxID=77585 RepID=A0ABN1F3C8_9PROT
MPTHGVAKLPYDVLTWFLSLFLPAGGAVQANPLGFLAAATVVTAMFAVSAWAVVNRDEFDNGYAPWLALGAAAYAGVVVYVAAAA